MLAAACEGAEVKIQYEQGEQQVYLNGENITSRLRNEEVGNMASQSIRGSGGEGTFAESSERTLQELRTL